MIKRIKRKYALIVMSSVMVVIGLIITAINVTNYSSINSLLDERLTMLVKNDGLIPEVNFGEPPRPEKPEDTEEESGDGDTDPDGDTEEDPGEQIPGGDETPGGEDGDGEETGGDTDDGTGEGNGDSDDDSDDEPENNYQHMSPETPFELRYFSVKLSQSGEVLDVYTDKIVAVNDTKAADYARDIFSGKSTKDRGYVDTYRYMVGTTDDGNLIYVFLDANREIKSFTSFIIASITMTALGMVMVFLIVILLSNTALRPIIESYEKQKRFITDAGHEMKTPLTIISANTEIIEMESGESHWSAGIKSQVAKLTDLTEKLVVLSKMEEGIKLEMCEFSLSEAFYDTCSQYESMAMSKGIRFDTAISENVRLVGNEIEIRRCISLMLDNAFRYVNGDGFVRVSVHNVNNRAEIKFVNSTGGVEKGSLDKWFDRFYRTDLSRNSATGGTGIGLSVVQAIVIAHGGTVKAFSSDGVNVEFTINI